LTFTGYGGRHIHQNGGPYLARGQEYGHTEEEASAATEGITEDEYADSATDPHGSHRHEEPVLHQNMHSVHSHYVSAEQDSYEEEHDDASSEGTR